MATGKKTAFLELTDWVLRYLPAIIFVIATAGCSRHKANKGREQEFAELNNLFILADKRADAGNVPAAIHFIDSAAATKTLNVTQRFKVLGFKAAVYGYRKDSSNCMLCTDSMLSLVKENGAENYREEYTIANYSKGDILFYEKRYDEAYKYYFIAKYLGKTSLDLCALSEYSYRLGMILFQQSRFTEAATSFEDAFNQSEKCEVNFVSFFRRQEVLSNTGLSFLKAAQFDSSFIYFNRALEYLKKYDGQFKDKEYFNDIARGVIYGNEGMIFKARGSYSKAEELFRKSIEINTKKGYDNRDAQMCQLQLAEVYFLNNKADSVGSLLTRVRQGLDTMHNAQAEIDWNKLMWKYNESRHQTAAAFKYLKSFTALFDSASKVERKLNSYDVSKQVKMLEDQYKINSLQKENKVKNLYLVIFLIATAFGSAIFLFSWLTLKNTKKNYKVLKTLNNQIEAQKLNLERMLAKLKEKSREKDRILHSVAHDLRTPVASISMLVDLILAEKSDNAKAEMLKLVKASSDSSSTLIAEILEAAGTEKKSKLSKESVDVNKFLSDAIAPLHLKAAQKQQTIQLDLLPEKQEVLMTKDKMQRVITNLVSNAIKFSEPNSKIKVHSVKKENAVQLIVDDNGIGIPENLKSEVFNMFTEAKRPGTSGEKPYGLGLSICRKIVEAQGGAIWFESKEGQGTTFVVELQCN